MPRCGAQRGGGRRVPAMGGGSLATGLVSSRPTTCARTCSSQLTPQEMLGDARSVLHSICEISMSTGIWPSPKTNIVRNFSDLEMDSACRASGLRSTAGLCCGGASTTVAAVLVLRALQENFWPSTSARDWNSSYCRSSARAGLGQRPRQFTATTDTEELQHMSPGRRCSRQRLAQLSTSSPVRAPAPEPA